MNKKLIRTVEWAAKSAFYKKKLAKAGIKVRDIKTLNDFYRLPFITSDDLRNHGKTFPAVPRKDVFGLFASGGTTGKQKLMYWTLEAHHEGAINLGKHLARLLEPGKLAMMIVPCDNLAIVGDVMRRALRHAGLVSGAMGPTFVERQKHQLIAVMKEEDPYAVMGNPARLLGLINDIKATGTNPASLGIKFIFSASEVLPKKSRTLIEKTFRAKCYEWGGMSEVGSTTVECRARNGQHLITETVFPEVLDLNGNEHVREGYGELYYTTLINAAYPLVRYKTEDIVRVTYKPCSCGLKTPRIWYKSRLSESASIGSKTLYAYQIDDALESVLEVSQNYRMTVSGGSGKERVEFAIEADGKSHGPKLTKRVGAVLAKGVEALRELQSTSHLLIKLVAPESLERTPRGKVANRINVVK